MNNELCVRYSAPFSLHTVLNIWNCYWRNEYFACIDCIDNTANTYTNNEVFNISSNSLGTDSDVYLRRTRNY